MTFDTSVLVYKLTILPIIDYSGFLLISLSNGDVDELQVLQKGGVFYSFFLFIYCSIPYNDRFSIESNLYFREVHHHYKWCIAHLYLTSPYFVCRFKLYGAMSGVYPGII